MYVANVNKVKNCRMVVHGARGVKVQYLLNQDVGAERLQLRRFIIEVGGFTPLEKHSHEHEIYILQGTAVIQSEGTDATVRTGDVIFIASWEEHQFRNMGEDELQFLCTKETL